MSLRTGPLTKRATRVIQIPGGEGGFVESKTVIYRTGMSKGAWGRQYGEMRLALMRAGNKGGDLRIYCHHRRHLFKLIAAFKAERTPPFGTVKPTFLEGKKTKRYFLNFIMKLPSGEKKQPENNCPVMLTDDG